MLTLGIETSCDETAAAVVEDGCKLRSNIISSQVAVHQSFGGVVPEIASRRHLEAILPVLQQALEDAGTGLKDIDLIAVTRGPGLIGALLVGVAAGKALAWSGGKPLVAVNHLQGHIYGNFLQGQEVPFPFLCLVVSGGHTDLIRVEDHGRWQTLGRTRDDAAGEAFDKVARHIGLGYPGGPAIDGLAGSGNKAAFAFPRAYLEEGSLDFSFSGLKTAVAKAFDGLAAHQDQSASSTSPGSGGEESHVPHQALADLAASFQSAVVDVLVDKTLAAVRQTGVSRVVLAGGVAANSLLREAMKAAADADGLELHMPQLAFCTDNAAMIASAGYYQFKQEGPSPLDFRAEAALRL